MNTLNFGFGPLEAEFWRWMFLMTRIGAAMLAAPFFGSASVAPQVRVMLTAAIAALVAGWTAAAAPPVLFSAAGVLSVLGEVLVGLTLGFVLQFAFTVPLMVAELVGGGMGMGIAASIDPQSGAHSQALSQYYMVVMTLVFLGLGGHLQWIALLVRSYEVFPPGQTWLGAQRLALVASFAGAMFATALVMALPIILVQMLVHLVTGVLSRSAPSLNLFSLGLPAGIVAGFAALIAAAPMLADRMTDLSTDAITATAQVLAPVPHG